MADDLSRVLAFGLDERQVARSHREQSDYHYKASNEAMLALRERFGMSANEIADEFGIHWDRVYRSWRDARARRESGELVTDLLGPAPPDNGG